MTVAPTATNMTQTESLGYRAHARTALYRRRIEDARECLTEAFTLCNRPYLSFSAGKDSSVVLSLALALRPDLDVRILTSGESRLVHANLDEVIAWWVVRYPLMRFEEVLIDRVFGEGWEDADFHTQRRAGVGDMKKSLAPAGQFDGLIMGLRDEESGLRKLWNNRRIPNTRHAIGRYALSDSDRGGMYRICPIARWSTADVAAYHIEASLPILAEYAHFGFEARTTMRLTSMSVLHGTLAHLRMRDPDAFRRLVARFPEIGLIGGC